MELHDGEDLRALIDRLGPLPPEIALRIAAQACRGLSAAHAADVVHRDIKPENLFLARQGDGRVVIKLLDFGIAKIRTTPEQMSSTPGLTAPAVPMTTSGQMLGTPLYMAPEQIEGAKHVDARSDVYSMGVTLYAMLTGAPPRSEIKSLMHLLRAITTEPMPSVAERAPWVSAEVAAVVERAMSAEKEARFANAAEMRAAIERLLSGGETVRQDELVGMTEEQKQVVAPRVEAMARAQTTVVRDKRTAVGEARRTPRRTALWVAIGVLLALTLALGALAGAR